MVKNAILKSYLYASLIAGILNANAEEQNQQSFVPHTLDPKIEERKDRVNKQAVVEYLEAKKIIVDSLPGGLPVAEKKLNNCIRISFDYAPCLLELSKLIQTQISQGEKPSYEIRKSVALVTQAYNVAPNDPLVRYQMAYTLMFLGQYENAQILISNTESEFPQHPITLMERGKTLVDKHPQEALILFEKAIQNHAPLDDMVPSILVAIRSIYTEYDYGEKIEEFATKYPDRWIWHRAGVAYFNVKKYRQATTAFNHAIRLGNDVESQLQMAVMHYLFEKKYELAISEFKTLLITLNSKNYITPQAFALVHAHLAIAYQLAKRSTPAMNEIMEVAKLGVMGKQFYSSLVAEFRKLGKLDALEDSLNYILSDDPENENSYIILGEIEKNHKDYQSAIRTYDKLISLNSKNDEYYSLRAGVYHKLTDYESALRDYDMAIDLKSSNSTYIYNKSCILARLGKNIEALTYLKQAILADRNLALVARDDDDFVSLRSDNALAKEFASLVNPTYDEGQTAADWDNNIDERSQ